MARQLIDRTGQRFNKLLVIERDDTDKSKWLCLCDCGKLTSVSSSNLKNTKSCGCLKREGHKKYIGELDATSAEYSVWKQLKARCTNPNRKDYQYYGGRGISLCKRWFDFSNFAEDMGPRPTNEHSIDRIDNSKGYSPSNCRWATKYEQANNRSNNIKINDGEESLTLTQLCRKHNLKYESTYRKYRKFIKSMREAA